MKRPILHHSIAALSACALQTAALLAADETIDAPSRQQREQLDRATDLVEKQEGFNFQPIVSEAGPVGNTSSASSSVITNSDGTATVTIEVNGKKETRSFKLGEEPFSLKLQDRPKLN